MNWKLAAVALVIRCFGVLVLAQTPPLPNPVSVTFSGPKPWIDVSAYGATGNGSTDDSTAINNALLACPPNGCTVYFGSASAYYIQSGLMLPSTTEGIRLVGECGPMGGNSRTTQTCSHIVSDRSIVMLTVGSGSGPQAYDSGLVIQDLGFQDTSSGKNQVVGAIRFYSAKDFALSNIHCQDVTVGYCLLFDGSGASATLFTQFGTVINPFIVNVKYPVQVRPQASEINFFGGNIDCNDNSTMGATIGMDLGKTLGSAGSPTGGEFSIFGTHIYNCTTGISMWNFSNMNYYGIMEQTTAGPTGDGIVIDGDLAGKPIKSIISGSIDEFNRGVVLDGKTEDTRVLANISNTTSPIVKGGTAISTTLPSTLILTSVNYGASGGVAIGSQIPTDLTIPGESVPTAPLSLSRRIYVDSANQDDLTVERSDSSLADLESTLLDYQPAASPVSRTNQTIYTFSVPYIPSGKGIRARVFWQCTTCLGIGTKTFSWKFGSATAVAYTGYSGTSSSLAYTEVRIFNNGGTQSTNTMLADGLTIGTTLTAPGTLSAPNQPTNTAQSLTFIYSGTDTITPQGFIVERQ